MRRRKNYHSDSAFNFLPTTRATTKWWIYNGFCMSAKTTKWNGGGKGWRRKRQSEKLRTCAHKSFTLATMFCNARCLSCFMSHHLRLGYYIAECCVLCVVMLLYDFSYCFTLFWMKQEKKVKKRFSVCLSAFTQYLIIKCLFVVHHSCVYIKFSTDCYRRTFVHRKINKRSNK